MTRRVIATASVVFTLLTSCSMAVKPATLTRPVSAGSMDRAMRAAMSAASASNWVPKTVSAETGFILAEREIRVTGRGDRPDAYRLEITLPKGGSGPVVAKVTPPPGVLGGAKTADLAAQFLDAYESALRK